MFGQSLIIPLGRKLFDEIVCGVFDAQVAAFVETVALVGNPCELDGRADFFIHRALNARRPRTRYIVGNDARIAAVFSALLPDRLKDYILTRRQGSRR